MAFTIFTGNQSCQQLKSANPQHFHEFFTQIFLTIFLVKSKLSTAKKSKITTFSRVFHPKKSTIFSGNQSWIFGPKIKISNSVNKLGEVWLGDYFAWTPCISVARKSWGGKSFHFLFFWTLSYLHIPHLIIYSSLRFATWTVCIRNLVH